MLVDLIRFMDQQGFVFYYTIWMLLLGFIAFGTYYSRMNKEMPFSKKIVREILISWVLGTILFGGTTANLALFMAIVARIILEFAFVFYTLIVMREKMPRYAIALPFIIIGLIGLGVSSLWNPPTLMKMLDVDKIDLITPVEPDEDANIQDIVYEDLSDIRIVSQEYAAQLPRTELVETGYDVAGRYGTVDVYPINKTLRWISVYEPTRFFKKALPSPYYVVINAMDPGDRKKVATSIQYSEREPFWSTIAARKILNTNLKLKLAHPAYKYGDGYYVPEIDSWIYPFGIIDYNILPFATIYKQLGIAVLNGKTGATTLHEFSSIPKDLQKYLLLEEYFANERLSVWAKYHKWIGVIDYEFSQPEIFEPAEDLFYQYEAEPNRFYALLQFEPRGVQRKGIVTWAEVDANGEEPGRVQMYDARDLGLIGPVKSKSIIESEVSLYSKPGFEWIVLQPQFKFIKGRYVYVAPIYAGRGVLMTIKGVGIVDAKTEQVKVLFWKEVITEEGLEEVPAQVGINLTACEKIYETSEQVFYACEK